MDSSNTTPSLELLANELRSAINLLLMQTSLASAVFTIMVQLLFFSTPESRKRPVFWMNIVACLLGIMIAIVGGIIQLQQITPPFRGSPWQMYNFQQILMVFSPLLIDSVLLMRILAFYPIPRTPWHRIAAVLAFSVLCKIGRIVVESLGLVLFYRDAGKAGTVSVMDKVLRKHGKHEMDAGTSVGVYLYHCVLGSRRTNLPIRLGSRETSQDLQWSPLLRYCVPL